MESVQQDRRMTCFGLLSEEWLKIQNSVDMKNSENITAESMKILVAWIRLGTKEEGASGNTQGINKSKS